MKIGIFDPGQFAGDSHEPFSLQANRVLDDLFEIVPQVESFGYTRYWLGEHYTGGAAWRNTEILLAILCGLTKDIRIGVAGIKVHLHNPLLVALNFKMLEYLYSGRIDLGLARGGAPDEVMRALNIPPDYSPENYELRIKQLLNYFTPEANGILVPPFHYDRPPTWILATGTSSVAIAVELKLKFCLSIFHKHTDLPNAKYIVNDFKEKFRSKWNEEPEVNIAIAGICSSSAQKAKRLEKKWRNDYFVPSVIGNQSICQERLEEIKDVYNINEIIFMSLCYNRNDRIESYSLLSEKLGLKD